MTPQPKPTPRVRERKRLARHTRPIARKAPLPRGKGPRPMRGGSLATQKREATRLWSLLVRGWGWNPCACCGGKATDAAHIFARGKYGHLRWDLANGLPLCRPEHLHFGLHPVEWLMFVQHYLGDASFNRLRERALSSEPGPDVADVLADFRARVG